MLKKATDKNEGCIYFPKKDVGFLLKDIRNGQNDICNEVKHGAFRPLHISNRANDTCNDEKHVVFRFLHISNG